jgi:8-oxo-dGTP pyrophosphatase MutT (NUDIX family)
MTKTSFPAPFKCYMPPHFKVYGAICISPNNRILLVQGRMTGLWSFPKGHLEARETALQCALRELHEETGLRIKAQPIAYKKYGTGGYFIFSVSEEYRLFPQDSKEVLQARWFSVEEVQKLEKNIGVSLFCRHLVKSGIDKTIGGEMNSVLYSSPVISS